MFGVSVQGFERGLKTQNANRNMSIGSFEQNRNHGTKVRAQLKCSQLHVNYCLTNGCLTTQLVKLKFNIANCLQNSVTVNML